MATVTTTVRCRFLPEDRAIEVDEGTTVLAAAQANDIPVETVCAGKGTCGTCRVLIREASAPEPNAHDKRRLSEQQVANAWRLACQHPVTEGAVYTHPVGMRAVRVVESAELGRIRLDPVVQKIFVRPSPPSLHNQRADWSRIQDELAAIAGDVDPTLEALRRLAAIGEEIDRGVTVVIGGNHVVSVEPGDTTSESFGFAFDIGTTTVVGALMDLVTGHEAAVASRLNGQHIYGGDVISRMSVTMKGPEFVERVHQAVLGAIDEIVAECLEKSGVSPERVYELVFVGNTVMEHLLLGADPSRISYSPFVPTTVDATTVTAAELGLPVLPTASVWVAPCVASYVGGDIVGMMLSAGIGRRRRNVLAIDIGTNGEVVLQNGRNVYATSAPAGPAFEGAEIDDGMRAAPGAIERVRITDGTEVRGQLDEGRAASVWGVKPADGDPVAHRILVRPDLGDAPPCPVQGDRFNARGTLDEVTDKHIVLDGRTILLDEAGVEVEVIGDEAPIGICGSGLVDAIAEMLSIGLVEPTGRLLGKDEVAAAHPALSDRVLNNDTGGAFVLTGDADDLDNAVSLHAQDIRRLQLAKGSIRCGVNVVLGQAGMAPDELDEVLLAGAFGSYIDPANALAIGLIPETIPVKKIRAVGNAAGHGARMCLLSLTSRVRAIQLPAQVKYVELSAYPGFQNAFTDAMAFPAPVTSAD